MHATRVHAHQRAVGVGVGKLARLEAGREVGGQPRRRAVHAPAGVVHGGERLLAAVEQPQVERQLVACKGWVWVWVWVG